MNLNIHLEYIWLDGNYPQQLRSKTKIILSNVSNDNSNWRDIMLESYRKDMSKLQIWNFDGSSTLQAETTNSELLLNPVNIFIDPFKDNGYIVVSEVVNIDMKPHKTNKRYSKQIFN